MADEKKELKQVAHGQIKEKGLADKAAEAFLSEDTKTVGNYIMWDVVIPAIKNTLADVVIGGIEMVLFGSSRGSRRSRSNGRGETRVSYGNFYERDSRSVSGSRLDYRDRDSRYDFSDILLNTRGEAEEVVSTMEELVEKYGAASVSDLCSLCGINSKFTDNKWGWTDIRDFSYRRSGRGFVLDFAKPEYLGN